jgi:hypothetical protein
MVKQNVITWSYVRCSTTNQDLSVQTQQLVTYTKNSKLYLITHFIVLHYMI